MKPIFALLVAALVTTSAFAQKVADELAALPAKDMATETATIAKLMGGGETAIRAVFETLAPLSAAKPEDASARYTIAGLIRYAGRPGGEADRATLVRVLSQALKTAADADVKTFLINRLQEVGRDDAVPALAPHLTDDALGPHAAAALEQIGTPAATDALNKALPNAKSAARVAIIKSLGMLRSAGSVEEIARSLSGGDAALTAAAAWALANLGSTRADDVLIGYVNKGPASRRADGFSWMLLAAQRQAEAGRAEECVRTCRNVLRLAGEGRAGANVAGAALHVLVRAQGEAALNDLLDAAGSEHPEYRNASLDAARALKGDAATARFADRLKGLSPAAEADVLYFLGGRGEAARPAVTQAVKDEDPGVRVAALRALVALGGERAIPLLVDRVTTDSPDVAKPAAEMLSRVPGDKPLAAAADALASAQPKSKVLLLELLAARGARVQKDVVLKQATDADGSVRVAALRAMEKLAGEADATRLVERVLATKDASEESAALRAATAAAAQAQDPERRAEPFLAALSSAAGEKRGVLERGLAKLGGQRALEAVLADVRSKDAAVRDGAIRALAEWQDAAAIAPLLEIARSESDTTLQVTAQRGAIQVIKSAKLSDEQKAAAYGQVMSAARGADERKRVLGALGNEKGQPYFDLASAALDQPDVQVEAALATIKTALPPARNQPGLTGAKVVEALKRSIPLCPDANLKDEANRYLKRLESAAR